MSDTPIYDALVSELHIDPDALRAEQVAREFAWAALLADLFG